MARAKTVFGLTVRQKDLLDYIEQYVGSRGYSPSYDEMKTALGLASKSGIHRLVAALAERGHIKKMADKARSITVVKRNDH